MTTRHVRPSVPSGALRPGHTPALFWDFHVPGSALVRRSLKHCLRSLRERGPYQVSGKRSLAVPGQRKTPSRNNSKKTLFDFHFPGHWYAENSNQRLRVPTICFDRHPREARCAWYTKCPFCSPSVLVPGVTRCVMSLSAEPFQKDAFSISTYLVTGTQITQNSVFLAWPSPSASPIALQPHHRF